MASQGRKLDPPQAISALAGVRPPDLTTLRTDPALEAEYFLSWEREYNYLIFRKLLEHCRQKLTTLVTSIVDHVSRPTYWLSSRA